MSRAPKRQDPGAGNVQEESFTSQGIVDDTRRGLMDEPKWLSSLYFYDHLGSQLFEQITETPEYYPTRTEESILREHIDEILEQAGDDLTLAEMGSGSSRKSRVAIEALVRRQGESVYLPIDVSAEFLREVAVDLEASFPGIRVKPIAAEYSDGIRQVGEHPATRRLVMFLGSSIGNFEPDEQVGLLRTAYESLSPGDAFLLGTDLVKDEAILDAAYNDEAGVTAQFNLNILTHLNRELAGDADIEAFAHHAFWNAEQRRIEMHLVSLRDQQVGFPKADLTVQFRQGETIHTENSYKFTIEGARAMAEQAGFTLETTWTDPKGWFALHLLRKAA